MLKRMAFATALLVIVAGALYVFGGVRVALDGSGTWPRFVMRTPDYDALEADRASQQQRPLPAASDASAGSVQPQVPHAVVPGNAAGTSSAPAASSPGTASRGYWPDFRGPNRDGRYLETAIRTDWPREGLPRLWRQPIGLGYASFVVADGRAFTIEQRRQQEVVAAYDVETGRELWTNGWEAEFIEGLGGDGPRATP